MPESGYFISIGGGTNQKPLVDAAISLGLKTITVDCNDSAVGHGISNIKILESTHEYRKILNALSHIPLTNKIVGIASRSFGKATFSTAYLAQKLKLKGSLPEIVKIFEDKRAYLQFLLSQGLKIPRIYSWTSKSSLNKLIQDFEYPIILKPSNGSGKLNVEMYDNKDSLKNRIESNYPSPENFVLQEFIIGKEITVCGLIANSKFNLISISDKWTTNKPPFIEIAHTIPSQFQYLEAEIRIFIQNIIYHIGLENSPFVAEFKVNSLGELFLIECNPEVGGEFLADQLIPNAIHYPYFQSLIQLATGKKIEPIDKKKVSKSQYHCIFYFLPPDKSNMISSIPNFIKKDKEIVFFEKNLKELNTKVNLGQGNVSRVKVVGLSRKNDIPIEDWLNDLTSRIQIEY